MSALSLPRLRADGQAFTEEISRESYLAHSGHKAAANFTPIYEKYRDILGPEALAFTVQLFQDSPPETDERRSARYLLEWQLESQASRMLASIDETESALESSAYVETPDGRRVQYQLAAIEIAKVLPGARHVVLDDGADERVEVGRVCVGAFVGGERFKGLAVLRQPQHQRAV